MQEEADKQRLIFLEFENQSLKNVIGQFQAHIRKLTQDNSIIVQQLFNVQRQLRK